MTPNRTACAVLTEMRACYDTRNFSYMLGLIEELQSMVNRMEKGLWDQSDHESLRQRIKKLEKKKELLEDEIDELEQRS